jgi:hypothetical protein
LNILFFFFDRINRIFQDFFSVNFQMKLPNSNQPAAEKIYVKIMQILLILSEKNPLNHLCVSVWDPLRRAAL